MFDSVSCQCVALTGAVAAPIGLTRPSSSGSQKIHVKPRVSGGRPAEAVMSEAKDTDIEGAPTELTLADLMKHARHDGKGVVSVPLRQCGPRVYCS